MGSRSVASVVVSWGLVSIGIKLYKSAKSEKVSFKLINPNTGNTTKQKLFDSVTMEEVDRGGTVKGYEYMKDHFVQFTDEEIANMQAEKRDTLDIKEFVPASEIDPLHVEETFYTGPNKAMDKSYRLLYEVLKTTKQAAVGTMVSRGKEHLVVLRSYQHGIVLHQMFYDTEVRAFDEMCAQIDINKKELDLGKALAKQLAVKSFDKSKYRDHFIEKVNAAVETKLQGGEITAANVNSGENSNLVDSMLKSLESIGKKKVKKKIPAKKATRRRATA